MRSPPILLLLLFTFLFCSAFQQIEVPGDRRNPNIHVQAARNFQAMLNRATFQGPAAIGALTTDQFAYFRCIDGPGRRFQEIKTKADFMRELFAWSNSGTITRVIPYGGGMTVYEVAVGLKQFEYTISHRQMKLQVAKEKGC
ncbi:unnamed protein product [Caenorhabditis sp. 36 PRJEB53466]|nr:unnamed protein product [Caenorhabditis sp. 36 PRJEB53466]